MDCEEIRIIILTIRGSRSARAGAVATRQLLAQVASQPFSAASTSSQQTVQSRPRRNTRLVGYQLMHHLFRRRPLSERAALRHAPCHRFDDGVDGFAPDPSIGRRFASTCRKACRKKTFQLLLTKLALEFGYASPGQAQIVRRCDSRLRQRLCLAGTAACSQCTWAPSAKIISPHIELRAPELKLSSQCAHILTGHHPPGRCELHLPAKDTALLRHQFYPCLTFGVQSR
jgi:hypothetical protein